MQIPDLNRDAPFQQEDFLGPTGNDIFLFQNLRALKIYLMFYQGKFKDGSHFPLGSEKSRYIITEQLLRIVQLNDWNYHLIAHNSKIFVIMAEELNEVPDDLKVSEDMLINRSWSWKLSRMYRFCILLCPLGYVFKLIS